MQKPLTSKDKKTLKKKIGFLGFFSVIVVAIFSFIYKFILKDFTNNEDGFAYIPLVFFGIIGLFFVGVIAYMAWSFIADLNAGIKNCVEGIVEDKKLNISKRTSHGSSRSSRTKSSTKRDYYIIVNGTEQKVEFGMYNNVSVGDEIYYEIAPKSSVILHYEIVEEATSTEKHFAGKSRTDYPVSKIRQTPLTRQDKDILKSFYKQKLGRRLKIILFIGFPIVGLLLSGLGGLLIFLFPLPIIFIYQLYKLFKLYRNYHASSNSERKQLIATHVTDKVFTTISNNGSRSQKRILKTTYGNVTVPEAMYQTIKTGDEITIHKALDMNCLFGITLDEKYYPF